jgi:predicted PolB exonuclease-like 3'-5' exonuclease
MMNYLILDLESVPCQSIPEELKPEPAYGNATKKETRAKILKSWIEDGGRDKAMSTHPLMCEIVAIEMWSSKYNSFIPMPGADEYDDEREKRLLRDACGAIEDHDLIVGKAIFGFDLPVIQTRSMFLEIPISPLTLRRYTRSPVYDIQEILSNWEKSATRGITLDWLSKRLGFKGKSGDGSEVYGWWKEGRLDNIIKYCRQDVEATRQIFERMLPYYPIGR